jgi:hypothetical protein
MTTTPPPGQERQVHAALFLAYVNAAKNLGLDRATYAAGSPALQVVLDHPPLPTALIPGPVLNDFYRAVAAVKGREAIRTIGLETMRGTVGQLLARLFESTIRLYGRTPEALFSQIGVIAGPIVRGFDLRFEPEGARAGFLVIRPEGFADPLSFAVWEGVALYFLEQAGVPGTVGTAQLLEGGRAARIAVRW